MHTNKHARFFAAAIVAASVLGAAHTTFARAPEQADIRRCSAATSRLLALQHEQEDSEDNRFLFTLTHYLISSHITEALRAGAFERPDLVARMNSEFVARLPEFSPKPSAYWKAAMERCDEDVSEEACAEAMAEAHIDGDLKAVVESLPCMPQADWDKVYSLAIARALDESIHFVGERDGRDSALYRSFATRATQIWTRWKRNAVRSKAGCSE